MYIGIRIEFIPVHRGLGRILKRGHAHYFLQLTRTNREGGSYCVIPTTFDRKVHSSLPQ